MFLYLFKLLELRLTKYILFFFILNLNDKLEPFDHGYNYFFLTARILYEYKISRLRSSQSLLLIYFKIYFYIKINAVK